MFIKFSRAVVAFSCVLIAAGASVSSAQQSANDQLKSTSQSSRAASRAGTAGAAAQTASQNFDGSAASNPASAANSGAGAYSGQANSTQWQTDPSQNGSQSASQSGGCTSGQGMDANGDCQSLSTPPSKNAAPWQKLIDIATLVLLAISALSLMRMLFTDPTSKLWISRVIMALGAMVTLLGIAIMAAGQTLQGGILTAIGAFTAVLAYKQTATSEAEIAKEAAAPQIGLAASQLAKQATAAPKP